MAAVISGIVKGGLVVPSSPLPEGARVETLLGDSPELQAEFRAWDFASDTALELVEQIGKPEDALAFWDALQETPRLTPAQKELARLMRGAI